jgi:hypothetical protein
MPAIADPHRARPYVERSRSFRDPTSDGPRHAASVWIRTALQRDDLTRALADGVDPAISDELSLRAPQLTASRSRKSLARSLRGTIAEAHKPVMSRSRAVIIDRGAVLEAEDAIRAMIDRVTSSTPIDAEGMAIAERMLTNAERSPLYNASEPGSLRRVIRVATAAMDADDTRSHEFPIGV